MEVGSSAELEQLAEALQPDLPECGCVSACLFCFFWGPLERESSWLFVYLRSREFSGLVVCEQGNWVVCLCLRDFVWLFIYVQGNLVVCLCSREFVWLFMFKGFCLVYVQGNLVVCLCLREFVWA